MANLEDPEIPDSDSYNPSEHIDVEELRMQIQNLKKEIKDDYNQNFWKYFGDRIIMMVGPSTKQHIQDELQVQYEIMKESISEYILKNTEGLLELPAYLEDFNRMKDKQEADN